MSLFLSTAAVGGPLPSYEDLDFTDANPGLQTSHTFSGQSLGTADPKRVIVLRAMIRNTVANKSFSSITLDGNAMSIIQTNNNPSVPGAPRLTTAIAYLAYPSGTTGAFALTVGGAQMDGVWAIHPVALYDLRTQTPTASGNDDSGTGNVSSLTVNLNRLNNAIQVLVRAGASTAVTYSSSGFTSHDHVLGATGVMQCGLDDRQPFASPATLTSSTSLATGGAFTGTTWR